MPSDPTPIASDVALAEVRLLTFQVTAMVTWWGHLLGATPLASSSRYGLFATADGSLRILLVAAAIAGTNDAEVVGVESVSFRMARPAALIAAYERLAGAGIEPEIAECDGLVASYWYRDPDGNRIGLEVRLDHSPAALDGWLSTRPLEREPLAIEVDPDVLADSLRHGAPAAEILRAAADASPHFIRFKE